MLRGNARVRGAPRILNVAELDHHRMHREAIAVRSDELMRLIDARI